MREKILEIQSPIAVSVLTLREVTLANGIDESASVVVDYGMVSLMVEPSRSVS